MKPGGGIYRAVAKANKMSPEISYYSGGRYCSYSSGQHSCSHTEQGDKSPAGSKVTARYKEELMMNSGEPVQSRADSTIKPIDGKIA